MSTYGQNGAKCKIETLPKDDILQRFEGVNSNINNINAKFNNHYSKTESDNKYLTKTAGQTKILSGTSVPSSSLGNNGDVYLKY